VTVSSTTSALSGVGSSNLNLGRAILELRGGYGMLIAPTSSMIMAQTLVNTGL